MMDRYSNQMWFVTREGKDAFTFPDNQVITLIASPTRPGISPQSLPGDSTDRIGWVCEALDDINNPRIVATADDYSITLPFNSEWPRFIWCGWFYRLPDPPPDAHIPKGKIEITASLFSTWRLNEERGQEGQQHEIRVTSNDGQIDFRSPSDQPGFPAIASALFPDNETISLEASPRMTQFGSLFRIVPINFANWINSLGGWNCYEGLGGVINLGMGAPTVVASDPGTRITLSLTENTPRQLSCVWIYGIIRIGEDI